jgi:hypothetical protein
MLTINEATLEMHFHAALMDLFRDTFGLGPGGSIEFFKYSPQLEKFVGFDQAYVKTEMTGEQLYDELETAASKNGYKLSKSIYGYFLQFKVVKPRVKPSKSTPTGFLTPYFSSDLSTQRKKANDPSQHELLYQLSQNQGAMVYYACPMVFDRTDLYRPKADLDKLTLGDLSSCPSAYSDNGRHSLCFQSEAGKPNWCSDPTEGKGITAKQFASLLAEKLRSPDQLAANAAMLAKFLSSRSFVEDIKAEDVLGLIGDALTIVVVAEGEGATVAQQPAAV